MVEYIIGGVAAWLGIKFTHQLYKKAIRPKVRGIIGEMKSNHSLRKLHRKGNKVLENLLLPTGRDTTQLDHVVVTKSGIFSIETKNYSGMICGKEWDKTWVQIFPRQTKTIPNPVRQNYKHIKALQHNLKEFPDIPITSIIAFSNDCQLDVSSERTLILKQCELSWAIKHLSQNPLYTDEQVAQIANILEQANILDKDARKAHLRSVSLKKDEPSDEFIRQLFEKGKQQPVVHFTPEVTVSEHALNERLDAFKSTGPLLTINGKKNTIEGFIQGAKRKADDTVADSNAAFDHITCPYTRTRFPPSELINLERGLWLSYFTRNTDFIEYISSAEGFREMFPEDTHASAFASAYLNDPSGFTEKAKNNSWYQNIVQTRCKPKLDEKIQEASSQVSKEQCTHTKELDISTSR